LQPAEWRNHPLLCPQGRYNYALNRCLGYAQCVPLAPKTLKLSGEEALEYDPNPDDAQRQQVLRAAASCPVQAILVEELDAKKEVQREHSEKRKRL
jgi:ferredoxin